MTMQLNEFSKQILIYRSTAPQKKVLISLAVRTASLAYYAPICHNLPSSALFLLQPSEEEVPGLSRPQTMSEA